ncbi:tyrosine--tRNA ligase [Candidatus Pacebacteria bacterium]|nr:tyrosine--tRNA ligase [Candidatus Paceibacterota bacterium]
MKLSEELTARGFVYQTSDENLEKILDDTKRTVYLGIDPTATSIHVGNLVPYMLLNHLMQAGHRVILLMGGGTGLIGDPGGKSEERPFSDPQTIQDQAEAMEQGIRRFVAEDVEFVNNYDWLQKLSMIEFLRDVGKHFTVNSMIKKDIVANRLTDDNSISYTEFSYSLLQAYDYYHLHNEYQCDLQIGGSDQWSNIIAGVDYIRRRTGDEVFALTLPLVTDKATGKKFGKSEGNAIWLNPELTTPYQFYQFWLNTSDENVIDYLKIFTFVSLDEITKLAELVSTEPAARTAQKRLATEVTTFVHGAAAEAAEKVSSILFGGGEVSELNEAEREMLLANAPCTTVQNDEALVDVLVGSGLASSKREARTFITDGAVAINGEKVTDPEAVLAPEVFTENIALLQRGKKQLSILVRA